MPAKRKILFLGESYRADAITWMNGLKDFGDFDIVTWELKTPSNGLSRVKRMFEYSFALSSLKKMIRKEKPDMVIAERTTSYGFLAAVCGVRPIAIAQQGRTDLWPEHSPLLPLKKILQAYAFRRADLIHAWGPVMTISMQKAKVDMKKVLVMPKGIDLTAFRFSEKEQPVLNAIVTRSLTPEYKHDVILDAFSILNQKGMDFVLTIIGDGPRLNFLKQHAKNKGIEAKVHFMGRIPNTQLPGLLSQAGLYISMPTTEGVSASLFEAMAAGSYPIVTDIPGNQSWIRHRENGQLVPVDDAPQLALEILWFHEHQEQARAAVKSNRTLVEQQADYSRNMKCIADRYHQIIENSKNN